MGMGGNLLMREMASGTAAEVTNVAHHILVPQPRVFHLCMGRMTSGVRRAKSCMSTARNQVCPMHGHGGAASRLFT